MEEVRRLSYLDEFLARDCDTKSMAKAYDASVQKISNLIKKEAIFLVETKADDIDTISVSIPYIRKKKSMFKSMLAMYYRGDKEPTLFDDSISVVEDEGEEGLLHMDEIERRRKEREEIKRINKAKEQARKLAEKETPVQEEKISSPVTINNFFLVSENHAEVIEQILSKFGVQINPKGRS